MNLNAFSDGSVSRRSGLKYDGSNTFQHYSKHKVKAYFGPGLSADAVVESKVSCSEPDPDPAPSP